MLDVFDRRFRSSDFLKNTNNSYRKLDPQDVRSKDRLEQIEENTKIGVAGKRVFSLASHIEQLPFADSTFDAYIANLVLQFTPNYLNMLCEAYRTLKDGCNAAFSIYGREENCTYLTFVPDILEENGVEIDEEATYNFDTIDTEQIIEDAKEVGFRSVKSFYLPFHYSIANGNEMWEMLNNTSAQKDLQDLDADTLQKVKNDIISTFDERFGEGTDEMISFEVAIIVCTK